MGSMYEIQMYRVHHVVSVTWPTQILSLGLMGSSMYSLPSMNAIGLDILGFFPPVFQFMSKTRSVLIDDNWILLELFNKKNACL